MTSPDAADSEILIVGAGIFGTSTAYHLSLSHPNPARITVLDDARVPASRAASSDINKIVRADYSKAFYMDLAYEAMEAWTSWPFLRPFFHQTGWLALDEKDSDLSVRIRANFRSSGRPDTSADITLDEVKNAWGGVLANIDTTGFDKAYTNSSAGWADASSAVEAMMSEAVRNGIKHEVGDVSEFLRDGGDGDLTGVRTSDGRVFPAEKILLAMGAWTPWLLAPLEKELQISAQDSIQTQLQAAGVCVAIFKVSEDEAKHYSQMPVLIYGEQGEVFPPNGDGLFKFTNANTFRYTCRHPQTDQEISVPAPDQKVVPEKLKQQSIEIIRQRIPEILSGDRSPDDWRICWDAISPDQNQLICRHPDQRLSNLYLATAGSFHSWKFLPTIGRYVANVLDGRSNGPAKDEAWRWKTSWSEKGAHPKVLPKGELSDFLPGRS